ncbi:MAG: hypothetical protein ABI877_21245 [Gemmatimonadaceae bacterium]
MLATLSLLAVLMIAPDSDTTHTTQQKVGTVHFTTTCAPDAQPIFNRAVAQLHSFAFGASRQTFQEVLRIDPNCAIAYWGLALGDWGNPFAAGIKPNEVIERGRADVERARVTGGPSEREHQYVEAVAHLYQDAEERQPVRVAAYRAAMSELAARHPADTEATIFAELASVFAADPADKSYASQIAAGATLERLFKVLPDHPGLAHYIIHAYDVPPLARRAVVAARRYAQIAPSTSHALHMPSHTYTRIGAWSQSIEVNIASAKVAHAEGSTAEELHASDYQIYAYLQRGQDRAAKGVVDAVAEMIRRFDPNAMGTGAPPAAGFFAIAAIPARYALERDDWAAAAALESRPSPVPFADAVTHFARALGAARIGDSVTASAAIDALGRIRLQLEQHNESYWSEQVEIERLSATAWLALARGKKDEALSAMRAAAEREDATEKNAISPGPLAPARELLGDMFLATHDPKSALTEYEATLKHEPNRYRALAGAARAASEAGNVATARTYYAQLLKLGDHADRPARPQFVEAARIMKAAR